MPQLLVAALIQGPAYGPPSKHSLPALSKPLPAVRDGEAPTPHLPELHFLCFLPGNGLPTPCDSAPLLQILISRIVTPALKRVGSPNKESRGLGFNRSDIRFPHPITLYISGLSSSICRIKDGLWDLTGCKFQHPVIPPYSSREDTHT